MRVIVCHRQKALVHLARLQAERQGVQVQIARDGKDVVAKALAERPDAIVLGNDLENPSTEETIALLKAEPTLKGVQVILAKGMIPDLRQKLGGLGWPRIPSPPKF